MGNIFDESEELQAMQSQIDLLEDQIINLERANDVLEDRVAELEERLFDAGEEVDV